MIAFEIGFHEDCINSHLLNLYKFPKCKIILNLFIILDAKNWRFYFFFDEQIQIGISIFFFLVDLANKEVIKN